MDNHDQSYEPMDIDLSIHSNNAMDISFNKSDNDSSHLESPPVLLSPNTGSHPETMVESAHLSRDTCMQPALIKKFHIIKHKETNLNHTTKVKIVSAVIILFLSVVIYQIRSIQCSNKINPEELRRSISMQLFGQSSAINNLINAMSVEKNAKILFLYGSTGVGKTFTGSLILEHLGHYSNVYHYMMPSFRETFTTEFMIGLTVCKHTTIIVDDLTVNDMDIKAHLKDIIIKSQNLGKETTIVLIYNCHNVAKDFGNLCDESFPRKLLHNINDIDAFKTVIKFETLKEEHLRKCIDSELGNRKLSKLEYDNVLKNFNVSQDGCKGVYTKIKFLDL